jgi:ribosomal protein L37E
LKHAEAVAAARVSYERECRVLIRYIKHKLPQCRDEVLALFRHLDTVGEDVELNDRWLWDFLNEYAEAQKQRPSTGLGEAQIKASENGVRGVDREKAELLGVGPLPGTVRNVRNVDEELEPDAEPEEGSPREGAGGPGEAEPSVHDEFEGEGTPPLPDEEKATDVGPPLERCPRCGGKPVFDSYIGATICSSCGSPMRRKPR